METSNGAGVGGLWALAVIAYRNVWRNGRRTALCVVAVAIAVFFNIFMRSWIEGMMDGIEEAVRTFETGHVNAFTERFEAEREYLPVQYPLDEGRSSDELVAEIEALPGVEAALPRISAYATLFDSTVKHAVLWGVDPARETKVNRLNLTDRDEGLVEGRFPALGANECAIGAETARKTGLRIGDKLPLKTVSAQFSDKYWSPTVVGVFEFDYAKYDDGAVIVPIDRLRRVLALGEATQGIFVYARDAEDSPAIKAGVERILGPGHVVRQWTDNYWVAVMRQSSYIYAIVFAVFQVVASFLIINTVLMVIHERIKEIGMMGALGMTRREIVLVFFFESVVLSVLGSLAGCALGAAATAIGSNYPIDMELFTGGGMKEMPISGTLFLAFSPGAIAGGFGFGVLVSAACTLLPSLKSAFIEPVEALRR
ncbi:MAG TPA: ABC transporter permease [Spirochaetia bacterium]|nr:ABC transporter permease [Spirochaetia bacterium]